MKHKDDYIKLHKGNNFFGYSLLPSKNKIYDIVKETSSETILDYGSGKGHQYSKLKIDLYWGVEVDCYDPGYEPFFQLPNKTYDGVVCTEVLEHVPIEEVDQVLTEIFERATRFVYLSIATYPAGKTFPDGTNVHVTIESKEWWHQKVAEHNTNNIKVVIMYSAPAVPN